MDRSEPDTAEERAGASQLDGTLDALGVVVWERSLPGGRIVFVSAGAERVLGRASTTADGNGWLGVVHADDRERVGASILGARSGEPGRVRYRVTRPDGVRWVEATVRIARDGRGAPVTQHGIAVDVTELVERDADGARPDGEDELRRVLEQHEGLVREMHHRVKNNLQLMSSMVRWQLRRAGDPTLREVEQSLQLRIQSMALVHEHLCRGDDVSAVAAAGYLGDLVRALLGSHEEPATRVTVDVECAALDLVVDAATRVGLIVSELVTNALKHAFPGGREGRLRVALARTGGGTVEVRVADDGVGIPVGVEPATTRTLGLRLVDQLARQLGAELRIRRGRGTEFVLSIPGPS